MTVKLEALGPLKGNLTPPPDKSISHRAVIFSSIARGESIIKNFLFARDPLSTVKAMQSLGIEIERTENRLSIKGKGIRGLREPEDVIDCENSGTTIRLLMGLLSAQAFLSVLTGDRSLRRRPMKRVINPLREMGARIYGRANDTLAPVVTLEASLRGIEYSLPVASAQVKSALILAALYGEGKTMITEPARSRDHTERMLSAMGANIEVKDKRIIVSPSDELQPINIEVPGDFSSAAFFIGAALIVPGSEVYIKNVGINPTRCGLLGILKRMGAHIEEENPRVVGGEPVADLYCQYSPLKATAVDEKEVPATIDEFPILFVIATQAEGTTFIRGASELRVKESDRIRTMTSELKKMGALIEELPDGAIINGPTKLKGGFLRTYHDHRVAMALAIAALVAEGETTLDDISSISISYPGFLEELKGLKST